MTTYGTMSDTQLEKNRNRLRDVADPTQPIAHLFLRVREICDTAELAGPEHTISDAYKISLILESLEKAGAYGHMLTTWYDKSEAKRSGPGAYDRFVKHCKEQEKHRVRNATARTEGFAHIATTTVATKRPAATDTRTGDNKHPRRQTNPRATPKDTTTNTVPTGGTLTYCWTHGVLTNPNHTSATCRSPAPGHQSSATLADRQGGSEFLRPTKKRGTPKQE
jgi:hypothetical protein